MRASRYIFDGFVRRDGRVLARFVADDRDVRVVPIEGVLGWAPSWEDEEPHPDAAVGRDLLDRAREWVALARTARLVQELDRDRRLPQGAGRRRAE